MVVLSAAFIGNLAGSNGWYDQLDKPPFNPPDWLFGPVWALLYVLIGISLYLLWTAVSDNSKLRAYAAFFTQLTLNALWSVVFFGLQNLWLAVAVISLLFVSIVWTMYELRKFDTVGAYLLVPYVCWVGFASYLTIAIAIIN
jgi:translocator protein